MGCIKPGSPKNSSDPHWLKLDAAELAPNNLHLEVLRLAGRPEKVGAVSPAHQHGYHVL